jgi:hypothetical protein
VSRRIGRIADMVVVFLSAGLIALVGAGVRIYRWEEIVWLAVGMSGFLQLQVYRKWLGEYAQWMAMYRQFWLAELADRRKSWEP